MLKSFFWIWEQYSTFPNNNYFYIPISLVVNYIYRMVAIIWYIWTCDQNQVVSGQKILVWMPSLSNSLDPDQGRCFVWPVVQTVCKDYQQTTKIITSWLRIDPGLGNGKRQVLAKIRRKSLYIEIVSMWFTILTWPLMDRWLYRLPFQKYLTRDPCKWWKLNWLCWICQPEQTFSFRWFKKGQCQLQAKVCAQSTGQQLVKLAQEKVWLD